LTIVSAFSLRQALADFRTSSLTTLRHSVAVLAEVKNICSATSKTDVNFTQKSFQKDWTL
jgi:hypothetical protein